MSGSFIIPLAAGSQAAAQGWRWSYYSLAIALTVLFLAFIVVFEETKYIPVSIAQNENSPSTTNQPSPSDDLKSDLEKTENDTATRVISIETSIPMKLWRQRLRLTTITLVTFRNLYLASSRYYVSLRYLYRSSICSSSLRACSLYVYRVDRFLSASV